MAAYGWGTDRPVAEWLFAEGHRFDFYQAVRLLEMLHPEGLPVGESAMPEREAVRFESNVSLAFPASDVEAVSPPSRRGAPARLTVNFLGLAGGLGPLPAAYTEMILERLWQKDTALRDFLTMFNHRLVSLMHRVRKRHRVGLAVAPPGQDPLSPYLFSLLGLGTPGLRHRMRTEDRCLLLYTGLLAQRPRSMAGLELLLSDYFRVGLRGRQFIGQWQPISEDQLTKIGVSGQNQYLGRGVVLGTRVWDQQRALELRVGPLTLTQFLDFLPGGRGFLALGQLTRFYVGQELDVSFRFILQAAEVPESYLSARHGPRLGWTSWLKTRAFSEDDSQVQIKSVHPYHADGGRQGRG
jgi:type VI secretion system protein ImpH